MEVQVITNNIREIKGTTVNLYIDEYETEKIHKRQREEHRYIR